MILTIDGQQVALKKGASIEYVSENRIFTDADDYSMEIELPLAGCQQNIAALLTHVYDFSCLILRFWKTEGGSPKYFLNCRVKC